DDVTAGKIRKIYEDEQALYPVFAEQFRFWAIDAEDGEKTRIAVLTHLNHEMISISEEILTLVGQLTERSAPSEDSRHREDPLFPD
ncbi:MAG: hypothetical protein HQK54_16895, partial [Oligoflexales bacterium]|nr:hypothetical protein [Oligoflexales bacterium]